MTSASLSSVAAAPSVSATLFGEATKALASSAVGTVGGSGGSTSAQDCHPPLPSDSQVPVAAQACGLIYANYFGLESPPDSPAWQSSSTQSRVSAVGRASGFSPNQPYWLLVSAFSLAPQHASELLSCRPPHCRGLYGYQ